ncbi:MAG TPA: S8 family serine peptidase [Limnobacter sp.]|uniref:S8 family serine peptidase n=1 Tax=Limnobacter sp. TaxID=2003368 RepID=UPI002ED838D0
MIHLSRGKFAVAVLSAILVVQVAVGSTTAFQKKSGGTSLAVPQPESLTADERVVFVEMAPVAGATAQASVVRANVEQLLDTLRLQAVVGGRLLQRFWLVQLPTVNTRAELQSAVERLRNMPGVVSVSENRRYSLHQFSDPGYTPQFALYTGASESTSNVYNSQFVRVMERTAKQTDRSVRVAVLDSGVVANGDLAGQFDVQANFVEGVPLDTQAGRLNYNAALFPNAMEPANSGPNGIEPFYHGSKVQSLINASRNTVGVAGINPDFKVSQIRVLSDTGGNSLAVMLGLVWSVDLYERFVQEDRQDTQHDFFPVLPANAKPADVINLSLGGQGTCTQFEQAAIDFVNNNTQALIVAAAGNDGLYGSTRVPSSPANCNGVISVGAATTSYGSATYSNVSPALITATLGGEGARANLLPVTDPSINANSSGFSYATGTSFSTPLVSAVLASAVKIGLLQSMSNRQAIINALKSTGYEYQDQRDFCGANTQPSNNMRPCGTILNTVEFLKTVTGEDLLAQAAPAAPSPGSSNAPPPPSTVEPDQPSVTAPDAGSEAGGQNPPESRSVQFTGTVDNVDPLSVQMTANDSAVAANTYAVSYSPDSKSFLVTVSVPGAYTLRFQADRAVQSQNYQPAAAGQSTFVSNITLDPNTRNIAVSDPTLQPSGSQAAAPAPSSSGGGGGGALRFAECLVLLLGLWGVRRARVGRSSPCSGC